jgi:hypothetical protein
MSLAHAFRLVSACNRAVRFARRTRAALAPRECGGGDEPGNVAEPNAAAPWPATGRPSVAPCLPDRRSGSGGDCAAAPGGAYLAADHPSLRAPARQERRRPVPRHAPIAQPLALKDSIADLIAAGKLNCSAARRAARLFSAVSWHCTRLGITLPAGQAAPRAPMLPETGGGRGVRHVPAAAIPNYKRMRSNFNFGVGLVLECANIRVRSQEECRPMAIILRLVRRRMDAYFNLSI